MAKRKKRKKSYGKRRRRKGFLSGISAPVSGKMTLGQAAGSTALHLGTMVGGVVAGLVTGQYSFYAGLPVTFYGIYKRNRHLITIGSAMMLTPHIYNNVTGGGQTSAPAVSGYDEMEGFSPKAIAENTKARMKGFFSSFSEKLTLKKGTMSGLGEVSYFVSPYGSGNFGSTELDRVQEQIAQLSGSSSATPMSGSGYELDAASFGELESIERNF